MAKGKKKPKCWSYAEGAWGYMVTVEERKPGGIIYARAYDPKLAGGKGGYRRKTLGHRDRERAKVYAVEQAAKLRQGKADITAEKATLARVFALYLTHRTPRKSRSEQEADQRRAEMWTRVLGAAKDPNFISPPEWERFIDQRRSGMIDARGRPVTDKQRKPVGDRAVEADCLWLRWTLNWAVKWRYPDGTRLLHQNGTLGLDVPTERNPKRPVSNDDRYAATRAVSDNVMMEVRWNGRRLVQRSYLSELLDIANGTARRITAICGLRYQDFRLEPSKDAPYGSIRWPEDTDKEGREWLCPIDPTVRTATDRIMQERPGIGAALVFPSPTDPTQSVTKDLASEWLLEAERMAGLPKLKGGVWHPFRRKWATARKHLPLGGRGGGRWLEVEGDLASLLPATRRGHYVERCPERAGTPGTEGMMQPNLAHILAHPLALIAQQSLRTWCARSISGRGAVR